MSIKEIVQQYIDKGNRCKDQSADANEQGSFTFWDGFTNCAENIMRELEENDRERQMIYDALCEILLVAENNGGYYQCNYSLEDIQKLAEKYTPKK